jgi:uncharacterized protein
MDIKSKGDVLIIFVRNPVLGKVKTRLATDIGNEKALKVYLQLLKITSEVVMPLNCVKFVYYSNTIIEGDCWDKEGITKRAQTGDNLGQRMKNAFAEVFDLGFRKTIVIGSDCPDLRTYDLEQAFKMLESHDMVIGPAMDGGYYLLGMKKLYAGLFEDKPWGTDMVLLETLHDLETSGLSFFKGRIINDVDTIEDLKDTVLDY